LLARRRLRDRGEAAARGIRREPFPLRQGEPMNTTPSVALVTATVLLGLAAPPPKAEKRHVNLPEHRAGAPFSDAVEAGNTIYIAGKLGLDPKTGKPPADVSEEAKLALDAVKAVVDHESLTMDDLVSVQVFCSDVSHYDAFNAVYKTYFKKDP